MPLRLPASAVAMLWSAAAFSLLCPVAATSQEKSKFDPNKPTEPLAVDPEIRALYGEASATLCQNYARFFRCLT